MRQNKTNSFIFSLQFFECNIWDAYVNSNPPHNPNLLHEYVKLFYFYFLFSHGIGRSERRINFIMSIENGLSETVFHLSALTHRQTVPSVSAYAQLRLHCDQHKRRMNHLANQKSKKATKNITHTKRSCMTFCDSNTVVVHCAKGTIKNSST